MHFLGLLAEDGSATLAMEQMARAAPALRMQQLKSIVESRYEWLWSDSAPQTYEEFASELRQKCGLQGDTFARAERFVMAAARNLDIALPFDRLNRRSPQRERPVHESPAGDAAWRTDARNRYFAFLLGVAERQSKKGTPDPTLLDRIERYVGG